MNENKEIEKLSETGEQSAEVVSGGVDRHIPHRPIRRPKPPKRPSNPPACLHAFGNCSDCGKRINKLCMFNGKAYCTSCWKKHANESLAPAETPTPSVDAGPSGESLSESDLLQVSGGINPKALEGLCEYVDHEYTCRSCGKTFIRRDPTGVGVGMAPRPVTETIYCDECLSKLRVSRKK